MSDLELRFTEHERRILLYALDGFIRATRPSRAEDNPTLKIALDLFNRILPQQDGMIVERIEP